MTNRARKLPSKKLLLAIFMPKSFMQNHDKIGANSKASLEARLLNIERGENKRPSHVPNCLRCVRSSLKCNYNKLHSMALLQQRGCSRFIFK